MRFPLLIRLSLWLVLALHLAAAGSLHASARLQSGLASGSIESLPVGLTWADLCAASRGSDDEGAERPVCPTCLLHVAALVAEPADLPAPFEIHVSLRWGPVKVREAALRLASLPPIRAPPSLLT